MKDERMMSGTPAVCPRGGAGQSEVPPLPVFKSGCLQGSPQLTGADPAAWSPGLSQQTESPCLNPSRNGLPLLLQSPVSSRGINPLVSTGPAVACSGASCHVTGTLAAFTCWWRCSQPAAPNISSVAGPSSCVSDVAAPRRLGTHRVRFLPAAYSFSSRHRQAHLWGEENRRWLSYNTQARWGD